MPTTLYFSFCHTNSIAMLYLVYNYKKKFESIKRDLTHSKIMIFLVFLVRRYCCLTSHKIVLSLEVANLGLFVVKHSLAYKNKQTFKTVYDICMFRINIYDRNEM